MCCVVVRAKLFILLDNFLVMVQNILSGTPAEHMSNCLGQYQDRHSIGPDLDPDCLLSLSADEKVAASKERFHILQPCKYQVSKDAVHELEFGAVAVTQT